MKAYEMFPVTRELFGTDTCLQTGKRLKGYGVTKCVLVTDEGIIKAGIAAPIIKSIEDEGIGVVMYDKVLPDPPDTGCLECYRLIEKEKADGVVAIGGGSSMDLAKVAALLTGIPDKVERVEQIYDYSSGGGMMKPSFKRNVAFINIPTTSGTGAESTMGAVITQSSTSLKMVWFNEHMLPDMCIIDPTLTLGLPKWPTVTCGMDAIAHCVEHLIGIGQLEFMDDVLFDAVQRVWRYLPVVVKEPSNLEARSQVAWGAHHALCRGGFSNGHAIAQSLGGVYHDYHLVHGHCCAITLPAAIRWHAESRAVQIRKLADCFGVANYEEESNQVIADRVANAVLDYYKALDIPTLQGTFAKYGIKDDKDAFLKKMLPAVKKDSLIDKWTPAVHTKDEDILKVLEDVWNDV